MILLICHVHLVLPLLNHQTSLNELPDEYTYTWSLMPDNESFASFDSPLAVNPLLLILSLMSSYSLFKSLNVQVILFLMIFLQFLTVLQVLHIYQFFSDLFTNLVTCLLKMLIFNDVYQWRYFII